MDIDPALAQFLNKWLSLDEEGQPPDGYFRFVRGRTASQARACGVEKIDAGPDVDTIITELIHTIDRLVQDEYRLGQQERQAIFIQWVERGSTRSRDWCCAFDPGDVADALSAVGGPLGAELAGRLAVGCIGELLKQNRDLHSRTLMLLDSQCEMAMNIGQAPNDMSAAIEAMQPTLAAIGERLPEVLAAAAAARAPRPRKGDSAGDDISKLTPQERAELHLSNIQADAGQLASLIMNDGALLTPKSKTRLRELAAVIQTVTGD